MVTGSAPVNPEVFTISDTVLLYVHKVLRIRTGIRTGGVERHTSAFSIDSSDFNLISFTSVVFESGELSVRIEFSYCIRYARQHDPGVSILITKLLIYY